MADFFAGPGAPLTRAFVSCGWQCLTVDWILDETHNLADPHHQQEAAIFLAAALDCSTKSRAREILRKFDDGRLAPKLLRSEEWPVYPADAR